MSWTFMFALIIYISNTDLTVHEYMNEHRGTPGSCFIHGMQWKKG